MTRADDSSHSNIAAAAVARELRIGGALVIAFATSVALAWVSYVSHLPHVRWPASIALPTLGVILLAGGALAGVTNARPVLTGAMSGLFSGAFNLIVLGSMLSSSGDSEANELPSFGLRLLGFFGLSISIGALGGALGACSRRRRSIAREEWCRAFGWVAVAATFFLLILGGIVTSEEAGMAVPDWPNTFGSNMVLFPLVRMLSHNGVYYEHAHRLFATLVGLTTVGLAVFLWIYDRRALVRRLLLAAVGAVVLQGVLGGLRVSWGNDPELSNALRVSHGVLAQIFFALMVCVTAVLAVSWRARFGRESPTVRSQLVALRWLAVAVTATILGQHLLGALARHVSREHFVLTHLGFAFVVLGLGLLLSVKVRIGLRDFLSPSSTSLVRAIAKNAAQLALLLALQVALGFVAFVATGGVDTHWSTLTATTHQVFGALVLASGAQLTARLWRLRVMEQTREGTVDLAKPGFDAVDKLAHIS
ncbi:MAG: COX15/CtaA family protein [Planctomycetota bacterium]